jgi:hypothetical protein
LRLAAFFMAFRFPAFSGVQYGLNSFRAATRFKKRAKSFHMDYPDANAYPGFTGFAGFWPSHVFVCVHNARSRTENRRASL